MADGTGVRAERGGGSAVAVEGEREPRNGRMEDVRPVLLRGTSVAVRELWREVEAVASTDLAVLLEGERGTGRALVARSIHRLSGRSGRPLVTWSGAGGPGASLEALTRAAAGGTLVLPDLDRLSSADQRELLRFLDGQGHPPALRVVGLAARGLRHRVDRGAFSAPLYYRLRGVLVWVPSLGERREDLPRLFETVRRVVEERLGRSTSGFAREAVDTLLAHVWGGNLPELERTIAEAVERTPLGGTISPEALPERLRASAEPAASTSGEAPLRDYRRDQERRMVLEALAARRWNVSATARDLGISRVGLTKKIKVLGLVRPRRPGPDARLD